MPTALPLLFSGAGAPAGPANPPGSLGSMRLFVAWDAAPTGAGLINNRDSDMENATNWTSNNANTTGVSGLQSATPYAGTCVAESTRITTTGPIDKLLPLAGGASVITPGRWYLYWQHVRPSDGMTNQAVTLGINWKTSAGAAISTSSVTQVEGTGRVEPNGWTAIGLLAFSPATAAKADVTLSWANCAPNERHQFDGVALDYLGYEETGRMLAAGPGRGRNDETNTFDAGTATLTLGNEDGAITPGSTTAPAPYLGNVIPRRKIYLIGQVTGGVTHPIWAGYFTSFAQTIALSWSQVDIGCTDAFRYLSGQDMPPPYTAETLLLDTPDTYLPCTEPAGSLSAGNIAGVGGSAPLVFSKYGTGGGAFGAASLLPVTSSGQTADNGSTALTLNTTTTGQLGDCLDVTLMPGAMPTKTQPWTAELWFYIAAAPGSEMMIYRSSAGGYPDAITPIQVAMETGGVLSMTTGAGDTVLTAFGYQSAPRDLHLLWDPNTGAFGTFTLYAVGAVAATITCTADPFGGRTPALAQIGGIIRPINRVPQAPMTGRVSSIAFYATRLLASARITAHFLVGQFGGSSENEGNRVGGILNLAGWPVADARVDAGLTTLLGRNWSPTNPLALMQSTAANGGAIVAMDAYGKAMMQNRQHRIDVPSAARFAASTATEAEEDSYTPALDDSLIENVVEIDRTSGSSVQLVDAVSVAKFGRRKGSQPVALAIASEAEATSAGQARLLRLSTPLVRVASVAFRPDAARTPTLFNQLLSLELGDRITLAELSTLAAASSADYYVERIAHTWLANEWTITLGLSPVSTIPGLSTGLKLNDPVYGALDAGNALVY